MRNAEIADAFDELASLYELDGAVVYRVMAYRNAAKAIRESGVLRGGAGAGRAGGGAGRRGEDDRREDRRPARGRLDSRRPTSCRAKFPAGLVEITRLPGLGPKRVRLLHEHLGVTSLEELRAAMEAGRLADVPGFGPKAAGERARGAGRGRRRRHVGRFLLSQALEVGDAIVEGLRPVRQAGGAGRQRAADGRLVQGPGRGGGHRRPDAASCGPSRPCPRSTWCTPRATPGARAVTHIGHPGGPARGAGGGVREPASALHRLGEAQRGASHRGRAARTARERVRDRRRRRAARRVACATEEEVYERLGMQYIPPELRENRGELAAARKGELPELIELGDIRGDLHMHTVASDGKNTHRGDGRGRPRARLPVRGHHRPLGVARLRRRRVAR